MRQKCAKQLTSIRQRINEKKTTGVIYQKLKIKAEHRKRLGPYSLQVLYE